MKVDEFQNLLNTAVNSRIPQEIQQASEMYFQYVEQNQEEFLQNAILTIEGNTPLSAIAAIILKKNCTYHMSKTAIIAIDNQAMAVNILQRLLQQILSGSQYARLINDCAGEVGAVLIEHKYPMEMFFSFIESALGQDDVSYQRYGAILLEYVANCKLKFLAEYPIFELLQTAFSKDDIQVSQSAIKAASVLIQGSSFINDETDMAIPDDIQEQLIQTILFSLQKIGQQLPDSKKTFIKALDNFHTVTEINLEYMLNNIDNVFELAGQLLNTDDEDLFCQGVLYLESFANNNLELSEQQIAQMNVMLTTKIFPYLQNIDQNFVDKLFGKVDIDEFDDPNDPYCLIVYAIGSFASAYDDQLQQAFKQYSEQQQLTPQLAHLKLIIISSTLNAEFTDNNLLAQLTPQLLQMFEVQSELTQFEICKSIKHILQRYGMGPGSSQLAKGIMQYVPQFLKSTNPFIIAQTINMIAEAIHQVESDFCYEIFDYLIQIINEFQQSPHLIVQRQVLSLLEQVMKKTRQILINPFNYYVQIFVHQANYLNKDMKGADINYFIQLIQTLTIALQVGIEVIDQQSAQNLITLLLELLFNPISEFIHLLTNSLLDAVMILTESYATMMVQFLPQLMDKFTSILGKTYWVDKKDNIVADNNVEYNGFILTQHKQVFKSIGQLLQQLPLQMYDYSQNIIQMLASNKFSKYDFMYICQSIFALPGVAVFAKDLNGYQFAINLAKEQIVSQILAPDQHHCTEEVTPMIKSLALMLQCVFTAQTTFNLEFQSDLIHFIVETFKKLILDSKSSFINWLDGISYETKIREEDKKALIKQEVLSIYTCSDQISLFTSIVIQGCKTDEERKFVLNMLVEAIKVCKIDSYMCTMLKEIIRNSKPNVSEKMFLGFFEQFLNTFMNNDIKHPPIAQLLITFLTLYPEHELVQQSNQQVVQRLYQSIEPFDSYYFAFNFVQVSLCMKNEELYEMCVNYIIQHKVGEARYIVFDTLMKVFQGQKFITARIKTVASIINLYFENEIIYKGKPVEIEVQRIIRELVPEDVQQVGQLLTPTAQARLQ
ncbi:Conserved_hypothetical protein [Hexamita inflata]|uniref:Uncharacterized protein n=2 Tax=Hexamita inflata TaxID=28002 RepID=A0AA86QZP7_9EUKA|nr:Conserved hypothetical protein [Hexamita inflata]